jgi:DNA-binding CsgD family transcriptional regulator
METLISVLNRHHQNLIDYSNSLSSNRMSLEEVGNLSNEIFFQSDENFNYRYLNPVGCKWFGMSKDQIIQKAGDFLKKFYHPDTLEFEFPKIKEFYKRNYTDMVYFNYQQILNPALEAYSVCLVLVKKLKPLPGYIALILPIHNFLNLPKKVQRIFSEELFYRNHCAEFKQLTERESEILRLLAVGFNNPKISEQLYISRRTVEQHRKNINKKLHIHGFKDILDYAYAFDLV